MEEYSDSPDVVFVCVKYYSLGECVPLLKRVCNSHTAVIPVLNVFRTRGSLQEQLPEIPVLDGCIYIYGKIEKPGVIVQPSPISGCFRLPPRTAEAGGGESPAGGAGSEGSRDRGAFYPADPQGRPSEIQLRFSGGGRRAVLRRDSGDFTVPGEKQDLVITLIREIEAIGQAMGITS